MMNTRMLTNLIVSDQIIKINSHNQAILKRPRFFQLVNFVVFGFLVNMFCEISRANLSHEAVETSAYIDYQYAYDFNRPEAFDRSYTTQAARHNEFNVNLAYIDVRLNTSESRGRLALQAGTSVQSNYNSEPAKGNVSGPSLARHLQEATIGVKVAEKTWIDGGIFFSHIGLETWISKDNFTLTRSLVADYSPYYLSGVKLSQQFSDDFSAQLLIVNGWQNISENNSDKSVGTQIAWTPSEKFLISYNTLIGQEESPNLGIIVRSSRLRIFHDIVIKAMPFAFWEFGAQLDVGSQQAQVGNNFQDWYGGTLLNRFAVSEKIKIATRVEYYNDHHQIVLTTSRPSGFVGFGASLGTDYSLKRNLTWRNEIRALWATEQVFPSKNNYSGTNTVAVTSITLTI